MSIQRRQVNQRVESPFANSVRFNGIKNYESVRGLQIQINFMRASNIQNIIQKLKLQPFKQYPIVMQYIKDLYISQGIINLVQFWNQNQFIIQSKNEAYENQQDNTKIEESARTFLEDSNKYFTFRDISNYFSVKDQTQVQEQNKNLNFKAQSKYQNQYNRQLNKIVNEPLNKQQNMEKIPKQDKSCQNKNKINHAKEQAQKNIKEPRVPQEKRMNDKKIIIRKSKCNSLNKEHCEAFRASCKYHGSSKDALSKSTISRDSHKNMHKKQKSSLLNQDRIQQLLQSLVQEM